MTDFFHNLIDILKSPNFYVPVLVIVILIILGNFKFSLIKNKMKYKFLAKGCFDIDMWSISHLLLYVYFGYQFPNYFAEFLVIGSIWELFESMFCKENFHRNFGCRDNKNIFCKTINRINSCDYWYGKLDDLVMNMTGFVIGSWLATKYKNNNKLNCSGWKMTDTIHNYKY